MDDHNETLGAEGAGTLVEARGRTWSVLPAGQAVKARFAAWCEKEVRKAAFATKRDLPEADYQALLVGTSERIATGYYRWGQAGWEKFLSTDDGYLCLAGLLLAQAHPELDPFGPDPGEALDTVRAIVAEAPEAMAGAFREAIKAPKAPGEGTATRTATAAGSPTP